MARILVVDDAKWVLDYVSAILEKEGHSVTTLEGASLASLERNLDRFDIVITDIFMPDMDGFELISYTKKKKKDIKIIAISSGNAYMLVGDVLSTARMLSADACLKKPFTPTELCGTVDTLMAV